LGQLLFVILATPPVILRSVATNGYPLQRVLLFVNAVTKKQILRFAQDDKELSLE